MKEVIEKAIKTLAGKITTESKADDALKFTQAALNLAHVQSVKGGNAEAGRLCGEIVAKIDKGRNDTKRGA